MRTIILLAAAACLMGPAAYAHPMLDRASPAVGAAVSDTPKVVALTYSEPVEPTFSHVRVYDDSGNRVDQGTPVTHDGGKVLSVGLRPLPPGVYTVEWHVTSVDTHKVHGRFTFTVKPE